GVIRGEDVRRLRGVSASMGLMLETASERLSARGGPHFGSPDKAPRLRLDTIAAAGEERVPFTSGILIGIGETRAERLEALRAIRELSDRYRHVQEVIVQNFRAKPGTRMADAPEPSLDELLWTIAVATIVRDPHVLPAVRRASDSLGLAREDRWSPGEGVGVPFMPRDALPVDTRDELGEDELVRLFRARGRERDRVLAAADRLRREVCGDEV